MHGLVEQLSLCDHKTGAFKDRKTISCESWPMAKTMLSQIQAADLGFLRNVHGVTLPDKVPGCKIRKTLNIEPLFL